MQRIVYNTRKFDREEKNRKRQPYFCSRNRKVIVECLNPLASFVLRLQKATVVSFDFKEHLKNSFFLSAVNIEGVVWKITSRNGKKKPTQSVPNVFIHFLFFVSGIIWTDVRPSAFDSFHLCSFGEAYHSLALGLPIDIGAALQNCHLAKRFSVLDHFRVLQPSGWIDFHWLLRK